MKFNDFDPAATRRAFDQIIHILVDAYGTAFRHHGIAWEDAIRRQIFDCTWVTESLFQLFCMNATNRKGGAEVNDWTALAPVFANWDATALQVRYPLGGGDPHPDLIAALLSADRVSQIIGGGDAAAHRQALLAATRGNEWVELLRTVCHGGAIRFAAPAVVNAPTVQAKLTVLCGGIDLHAIPLARLSVGDLWRATAPLTRIPGIGRQLALNFIKDAGCRNATKPDIWLRKVAGYAFTEDQTAYPASSIGNDQGERDCVEAVLAFAQAVALTDGDGPWITTLAAVDRLLWLVGSSKLFVSGHQQPLLLPRSNIVTEARLRAVAAVLRSALR